MMERGIEFLKGHGTENDFVLLPDPTGTLELTASRVRTLCDRHRGLGADGVLRVVPGALIADLPSGCSPEDWFMDYRNADGSFAELCGNGARVFARYLTGAGLVTGTEFRIGSRSGARGVRSNSDGTVSVEMGRILCDGTSTVTVEGAAFTGLVVHVGNPHLVCVTELPVEQLERARGRGAADASARARSGGDPLLRHRDGGRARGRAHSAGSTDRRGRCTRPRRATARRDRSGGQHTDRPGGAGRLGPAESRLVVSALTTEPQPSRRRVLRCGCPFRPQQPCRRTRRHQSECGKPESIRHGAADVPR
jgi:diaminopimelate epimerase